MEINLPFHHTLINQWLIFVPLLHCLLWIFARFYFKADKLKRILLSGWCVIGVFVLMGCDRSTELLFSIVCFLTSCIGVGTTFAIIIFISWLLWNLSSRPRLCPQIVGLPGKLELVSKRSWPCSCPSGAWGHHSRVLLAWIGLLEPWIDATTQWI